MSISLTGNPKCNNARRIRAYLIMPLCGNIASLASVLLVGRGKEEWRGWCVGVQRWRPGQSSLTHFLVPWTFRWFICLSLSRTAVCMWISLFWEMLLMTVTMTCPTLGIRGLNALTLLAVFGLQSWRLWVSDHVWVLERIRSNSSF